MQPFSRETIVDRRQPTLRWSAILGGTILAVGLWIMLQVIGTGLGLSAVETDDAGSLRSAGIGTGVWSLIAPLIAMFIGAYVVGRLAGSRDRNVGAMHGAVTWALASVIGVWAMVSVVSSLVGGAARVGGRAIDATTNVAGAVANNADDAANALGVDANDLLGPVNQKLAAQGKPQVSAREVQAALRGIAQRSVNDGRIDREVVVDELARNTALTRADAEDIANRFGDRYTQLANRADRVTDRAERAALEAADKTGKALALGGLMMLLSLGAAVGGGALGAFGRKRDRERHVTRTTAVPPVVPALTDDAFTTQQTTPYGVEPSVNPYGRDPRR